jgi:WD40 repeat protein
MKDEINKIKNKMEDKEKNINEKMIDDKIKEEINILKNNINIKFMEQQNINDKIYNIVHNIEYEMKINYEFIKEPKNLKFKENITTTNTNWGWNDIFEIFISYIDNKEYLVSPNSNKFNLDIFLLINNEKIKSLPGHKNHIRTIRYFINNKNKNEYLISADDNKIVIIWDITNNYNIKYNINTKYGDDIYSCLLIFPHNSDDNYIITSTFNKSGKDEDSATKLYSLNNGNFIKYINNTNNNAIYYLLSWYNKRNNKYYIIQFSYKKIIINNLLEDELYSELINEPEDNHFSGFIYYKDNNDYLCSSSSNGYINIWDLYNKKIYKTINTNGCKLAHIIEWNKKYIIVADYNNKSFKIIDIDDESIYNIITDHKDRLKCVKKVNHPKFGESLLSAAEDKTIKLWTIE